MRGERGKHGRSVYETEEEKIGVRKHNSLKLTDIGTASEPVSMSGKSGPAYIHSAAVMLFLQNDRMTNNYLHGS